MNPELPPRERELLELLVSGELDLTSAEVQDRRATDRPFDALVRDLVEARTRLEQAGDADRALIEKALVHVTDQDRALARQVLTGLASQRRTSGWQRWRWPVLLVSAATLALVLWFLRPESPSRQPTYLDDGSVQCLGPAPGTPAYNEFRWTGELAGGDVWVLRVYSAEDPTTTRPLHEEIGLTGNRWAPSEELTRTWPDRIVWQVTLRNPTGEEPVRASASRSRIP